MRRYRKTLVLFVLAALAIGLPAFAGGSKKKPEKIPYEFPESMSPAIREAFTQECDKGQALYNLTCAKCHNEQVKGRTIVPDWSAAQLVGYELRVLNARHETGIPEEQISAEELGYIMTFLTYKKKNTK